MFLYNIEIYYSKLLHLFNNSILVQIFVIKDGPKFSITGLIFLIWFKIFSFFPFIIFLFYIAIINYNTLDIYYYYNLKLDIDHLKLYHDKNYIDNNLSTI